MVAWLEGFEDCRLLEGIECRLRVKSFVWIDARGGGGCGYICFEELVRSEGGVKTGQGVDVVSADAE
jgi:hypothetical protein